MPSVTAARLNMLKPVITIIVHWGLKPWDGPRTLYEMLDVPDKELFPFINDYRINLISPIEMGDFSGFRTENTDALASCDEWITNKSQPKLAANY